MSSTKSGPVGRRIGFVCLLIFGALVAGAMFVWWRWDDLFNATAKPQAPIAELNGARFEGVLYTARENRPYGQFVVKFSQVDRTWEAWMKPVGMSHLARQRMCRGEYTELGGNVDYTSVVYSFEFQNRYKEIHFLQFSESVNGKPPLTCRGVLHLVEDGKD